MKLNTVTVAVKYWPLPEQDISFAGGGRTRLLLAKLAYWIGMFSEIVQNLILSMHVADL